MIDFASTDPGAGDTGTFRNENSVRTTGGMVRLSTIWSGQNDVSPLVLPKNICPRRDRKAAGEPSNAWLARPSF